MKHFICIAAMYVVTSLSGQQMTVESPVGQSVRLEGPTTCVARLYEEANYRGYIGSFSRNSSNLEFGTASSNITGKLHLSIRENPKLTLDTAGFVGIGTINPTERITLQMGDLQMTGSNKGVLLNASDHPLITRQFSPFTSGKYQGIGRWGLFMESNRLTVGIPNISGSTTEFAKYSNNGDRSTLIKLNEQGVVNRPDQGTADLLPIAMGYVQNNGNIVGGSGNFTVNKLGVGHWQIILLNFSNPSMHTIITASVVQNLQVPSFISVDESSPSNGFTLHILEKHPPGVPPNDHVPSFIDQHFQFIVYQVP